MYLAPVSILRFRIDTGAFFCIREEKLNEVKKHPLKGRNVINTFISSFLLSIVSYYLATVVICFPHFRMHHEYAPRRRSN